MGWGKIRKKIYKAGHKAEPHAHGYALLEKTGDGKNANKNVTKEGTKGVANYGGYAALALQVVPGVGTAVGLGVAGLTAAAQLKMRQDAARKVEQNNKRIKRANKEIAAGAPIDAFNPDGSRKDKKKNPYQSPDLIKQSPALVKSIPHGETGGAFGDMLMGQFAPQIGSGGVPAAPFAGAMPDTGVDLVPEDAAQDDTTMWLIIGGGAVAVALVAFFLLRK